MDLDHLQALVMASIREAETINDCGPAYDELLRYLEAELPTALRLARRGNTVETDPERRSAVTRK